MKILQAIKNSFGKIFEVKEDKKQGCAPTKEHQSIRVFCPNGLIPYFFKNVVIVATDERAARREYERMLRKEIKTLVKGQEV